MEDLVNADLLEVRMNQAMFFWVSRIVRPKRESDEAVPLPAIQSESFPSCCTISSTEGSLVFQASIELLPFNSLTKAHRVPIEGSGKVDPELVFDLVPQHLRLISGFVLSLNLRLERMLHSRQAGGDFCQEQRLPRSRGSCASTSHARTRSCASPTDQGWSKHHVCKGTATTER